MNNEDLVLIKRIIEIIENNGNNIDDVANNPLPTVKSPIFIKGCKAIKRNDKNSIMRDENDQTKGFLKNCF